MSSSVSLGPPLALGRTAEIYPWSGGQVLKLFRAGFSARQVEAEARTAAAVSAAGLPVPAVGEMITVNDRRGILYERIEGESMLALLQKQPQRRAELGRLLADLHVEVHSYLVSDLPDQRQRLLRKIQRADALPPRLKEEALADLKRLPLAARLCHNDFHPDNILLTGRGGIIIDWNDAASGHPLADVARSAILMRVGAAPSMDPVLLARLESMRGRLHDVYLQRYFEQSPEFDPLQLAAWLPVVAAARLEEAIPGEQPALLAMVSRG